MQGRYVRGLNSRLAKVSKKWKRFLEHAWKVVAKVGHGVFEEGEEEEEEEEEEEDTRVCGGRFGRGASSHRATVVGKMMTGKHVICGVASTVARAKPHIARPWKRSPDIY